MLVQVVQGRILPLGPLTLGGGIYLATQQVNNAGPYALPETVEVSGTVTSIIENTSLTGIPLGAANEENWLDSEFTVTFDVDSGSDDIDLLVTGALSDGVLDDEQAPARRTSNLVKEGAGVMVIDGATDYTGETDISAGELVIKRSFSGVKYIDVDAATFTPESLVVEFVRPPTSGTTYKFFRGPTKQTYGPESVTLTGAGDATGTYDSATSTLTID
jgi:autotransporter-associated beta strand protein